MPDFSCDLAKPGAAFAHHWEHTVGSGHALLALRTYWQQQLERCHRELGFEHARFHGVLMDDLGTLICEEEKLLYSFFNADRIMDFLLSIGMRPTVELSFMPQTLASGQTTVFHYRGNVTPPQDYDAWGTLIGKLAGHWVERYGVGEVAQWLFEVWNEPNLKSFWTGSQADYFNLYRHSAAAIKKVDPALRVGGPATAGNAWIGEFLDFCHSNDLPVDFISTHYYPTDAFGTPGADTLTQLQHSSADVMRAKAQQTRDHAGDLPVYYTEWSISSNPRDPLHDEPFAAALAVKIIMGVNGLVDGYSYWTFSDIFEENYFPSLPYQGGFGLLNLYGVPKPAYRAFELLHRLGDELIPVAGQHETISAWAVRHNSQVTVLLINHAMPRHPINTEIVRLKIASDKPPRAAYSEQIDADHANPRRAWQEMGSPKYLLPPQVEQLEAASRMVAEPLAYSYEDGAIRLQISLPPHSVAALTVELAGVEEQS